MKRQTWALALLVLSASPSAHAFPILFEFAGKASGSIGSVQFSNKPFRILLTSDTMRIGEFMAGVPATPGGEPAQIVIDGIVVASFWSSVDASVFYSQNSQIVGFWTYGAADILDIQSNLGGYDLKTPVGPIAGSHGSWIDSIPTSLGPLTMDHSTIKGTTFSAIAVPEPLCLAGLGAGMLALCRRRRQWG